MGIGIPIFRRNAVRAPPRRRPTPDVAANKLPRNVRIQEQTLLRVTQLQTNEILKLKNIGLIIFLKDAKFYLAGSRRNESKVYEECCWLITETAG
jgi:hypothetical protein